MRTIVYVSSAVRGFDRADLGALLAQCRRNNRALGLTGMLIWSDGCFAQALEGPDDMVAAMQERIGRDPRHPGLIPLIDQRIETRAFPDWAMGCRELEGDPALAALTRDAVAARLAAPDAAATQQILGTLYAIARGVRDAQRRRPIV